MSDMLEDIKNKFSIVVHGATVKRWEETAKTKPPWDERNILISKFIPPGTSIIDIGSGAQTLREYLPTGCRYQPVDLVHSSEDVIFANFNKGKIPQIDKTFDIAICSGILEYILDPKFFITTIKNWASTVFLSYAILELNPVMKKRKENG